MRKTRRSPGSVSDLAYHLVWCPKYRRPVLTGDVAVRCEEIIRAKALEKGWEIRAVEVMPDHVHVLVASDVKSSPSFIANQFKGVSSNLLRAEFPEVKRRLPTLWSRSFFAATVGGADEATVKAYTETQYERPWRKP